MGPVSLTCVASINDELTVILPAPAAAAALPSKAKTGSFILFGLFKFKLALTDVRTGSCECSEVGKYQLGSEWRSVVVIPCGTSRLIGALEVDQTR